MTGFLFTYIAPLAFVLVLSMGKEAFDDIKRYISDKRANGQVYQRLLPDGTLVAVKSADIAVGQLISVGCDSRVPADMVLLKTSDKSGASFIRTDQLDGETDWKLRKPIARTQAMALDELARVTAECFAEAPRRDIYAFQGRLSFATGREDEAVDGRAAAAALAEPVGVDNMLWANTVVATGTVVGAVVYTGRETRSALNRTQSRIKHGRSEAEINRLSVILFALLLVLSFAMVACKGFSGMWFVYMVRFMILFSSIIPISMRVNLDMAKLVYAFFINRDRAIPGTIVRNSTIPEELGRITYLLTDKTGTLTQNDMTFKRLTLGSASYRAEEADELLQVVAENVGGAVDLNATTTTTTTTTTTGQQQQQQQKKRTVKKKHRLGSKTTACVRAIALCHNVTPTYDAETQTRSYQASSPDEVALVKFTERVGMTLVERDLHSITLHTCAGVDERYEVLKVFPFSSATKRMGIVLRTPTGEIHFYMKGADTVMTRIVSEEGSSWIGDETGNMAREGLRTLVFGMKTLTEDEYADFAARYHKAELSLHEREEHVQQVVETLERDLVPLCVTGVEDRLQENVRPTLEQLQHAGIKVWMLTGDKVETATCIAISAALFKPSNVVRTIANARTAAECKEMLDDFAQTPDAVLVIDGGSLQLCLDAFQEEFFRAAKQSPSVVCCRCSPTQKAAIVAMLRRYTGTQTCAIGDGGNDVSMILEADVGVGIEGKEGKQASLAADFSVTQFSHLSRLILWHGRNSYKRSAALAQFIMHRGLIISVIQAVFSALFFFAAVAIYQGWLLVGYSTFYTMVPVFSLILDQDVSETVAMQFPELYRDLQKGRELSLRTFATWVFSSVYQGGVIMLCMLFLFENNMANIVTVTFTVLILTELLNIAFEIITWNWLILLGELLTLLIYFGSMLLLPDAFSLAIVSTGGFWWRVCVSVVFSCLPISLTKFLYRIIKPPAWLVVNQARQDNTQVAKRFIATPW